jgi:predicted CoA-binding protein
VRYLLNYQEQILLEKEILEKYRNIAIVGLSPKPDKDSYKVGSYLNEHGYNIIPVNPTATEILGKTSYPSLSAIPDTVEVVDIFRKSEEVVPIVQEAIRIGAKVVWMQLGIINEEAARMAGDAGLSVVMDRCMKKMHESLNIQN